jgi:hypothetical protein
MSQELHTLTASEFAVARARTWLNADEAAMVIREAMIGMGFSPLSAAFDEETLKVRLVEMGFDADSRGWGPAVEDEMEPHGAKHHEMIEKLTAASCPDCETSATPD